MIKLKTPRELQLMRDAGRIVADCFELAREIVRPGITTGELDQKIEALIHARKATAAFKGYRGFPASICASINEQVVHGIPGKRALLEGDIISVDIGVKYKGYFGDSAYTFAVGQIKPHVQRLLDDGKQALRLGIEQVKPNGRLSQVSRAIYEFAVGRGYGVVEKYVGHGIGSEMHEEPQVPNFVVDPPDQAECVLKPGLVIAIEPMLNAGTKDVRTLKDRWTVVTADGRLSCHFEHTVAVTEQGHEVLTSWSDHAVP